MVKNEDQNKSNEKHDWDYSENIFMCTHQKIYPFPLPENLFPCSLQLLFV